MPLLHIIILALVQGVTEFLPISSSGHLILVQTLMDSGAAQSWQSHMMLDVAVHVGTLLSVLVYFRKDVSDMLKGLKNITNGDMRTSDSKLLLHVIIGSIPVIIAGFALHVIEPSWLLSVKIIAWTTLVFGIVLWIADKTAPATRNVTDMTLKDAILIGLAQCLALIPGTSRSGITMIFGRFLGFTRAESAHYSLLLGMVAISGAGVLGGLDIIKEGNLSLTIDILIAVMLAFASGWVAIALMMRWLEKSSFTPFAVYRIILGLTLLALLYWPAL
ncbi:MAG: undecaprenyl-diphosphate phosphatase [Bdellovibrionales bacterium]